MGCATVTRGTKEVLEVGTDPRGATVTLSNGLSGTSPASFKVSRRRDLTVTIAMEGYETVQVSVKRQIAGAGAAGLVGNVLVGGLIGAAVDAGSGATLELEPNPVLVTLVSTHAVPAVTLGFEGAVLPDAAQPDARIALGSFDSRAGCEAAARARLDELGATWSQGSFECMERKLEVGGSAEPAGSPIEAETSQDE